MGGYKYELYKCGFKKKGAGSPAQKLLENLVYHDLVYYYGYRYRIYYCYCNYIPDAKFISEHHSESAKTGSAAYPSGGCSADHTFMWSWTFECVYKAHAQHFP